MVGKNLNEGETMSRRGCVGKTLLDMLATDFRRLPEEDISLSSDIILHLAASEITDVSNCSYKYKTVVFSVSHGIEMTWGPAFIGHFIAKTSHDFRNIVHTQMFCNKICTTTDDELWSGCDMTRYCHFLSYDDYGILLKYLLEKHKERVKERSKTPRKTREQSFSSDFQDKALALFISRITVIMNNSLFWGETRRGQFSLKSPSMGKILK